MTLRDCVERGCALHPKQCFQTGFAPSGPGEPIRACVIGAAHSGYEDLNGRGPIAPNFFEDDGEILCGSTQIGTNNHPLNLEIRTKRMEGDTVYRRMVELNDEHQWSRGKIMNRVSGIVGTIHIP